MVQLGKDGNHTEEETWVGECWVGFKGTQDAKEDAARIERVVLEFEADRDRVDEKVHLRNDQIECTVRCGRVKLSNIPKRPSDRTVGSDQTFR